MNTSSANGEIIMLKNTFPLRPKWNLSNVIVKVSSSASFITASDFDGNLFFASKNIFEKTSKIF